MAEKQKIAISPNENLPTFQIDGIVRGEKVLASAISEPRNNPRLSDFIMADYTTRMSELEKKVIETDKNVSEIKSNYLTQSKFFYSCVLGLLVLIGAAWTLYSNVDSKYETRFSQTDQRFQQIDQRFQQVEDKIHSLDIRMTKVESRLENVEKKIDNIDDKLDILIQQRTAKH